MLKLNRYHSDLFGTYGALVFNGRVVCHTYELPWLNNARNVSCIPEGEYPLVKIHSERHSDCYLVENVPNRSGILIHMGNGKSDTQGCILPGLSVDIDNNRVLRSLLAMQKLHDILPRKTTLTIRSL